MTDRKSQLGNVAFGGNWSEEILFNEELNRVLDIIESAAIHCTERDVRGEEFLAAMLYVRKNIKSGPVHCKVMFEALRQENQGLRQQGALKAAQRIRTWAGM